MNRETDFLSDIEPTDDDAAQQDAYESFREGNNKAISARQKIELLKERKRLKDELASDPFADLEDDWDI